MKIFKKSKEIRESLSDARKEGKIISLVPTMGMLHDGHLSLIAKAKKKSDLVVVSVFVNKSQFNKQEDFDNYPRDLDQDINSLKEAGVDLLFCPDDEEIYDCENYVKFTIEKLADNLCGKHRGDHFSGVMLIICKLFNIIGPQVALFGEKDFQQLQIIKKLTANLNYDVEILGVETLRAGNGLALSSRNKRLGEKDLKKAAGVYEVLKSAKEEIGSGKAIDLNVVLEASRVRLLEFCDNVEYLNLCDEETLQIVSNLDHRVKSRIFVAVYLGNVRLIDNIKIN